jgi:uncharacterized protein YegP (UPF0339 family)
MTLDQIIVRPAPAGGYVWNFVAANNQIRANSEVFTKRSHAEKAVKNLIEQMAVMLGVAPIITRHRQGERTVFTVEPGLSL